MTAWRFASPCVAGGGSGRSLLTQPRAFGAGNPWPPDTASRGLPAMRLGIPVIWSRCVGDRAAGLTAAARRAEAKLAEREKAALNGEPTPQELKGFAAEHDTLARDRDRLADAWDRLARHRDLAALDRDASGSQRDKAARTRTDPSDAVLDGVHAGQDRDLAAGDRADARHAAAEARQRAATDRDAAAERQDDTRRELETLRDALHSRLTIGQAEGLLMARHSIDENAAFRLLTKLSQETHTKLRDVAAALVADANAGH